jgi:twitching motility protein PilT
MIDQTTLNKLLKFGVERGASDIHFEVGGPPRYRIKGELLKAKFEALSNEACTSIAQVLLGDRPVDLDRMFPEQDTSYSIPGVSRFRVSVFRQRGSVGCVLRVIPFEILGIEELNLPPLLKEIANTRRGLVVVTGATGMGKSTSIAAMLQHINGTRQAHVVTIEDPIEFLFENQRSLIIQREVGTDTHSYAEAMAAALRQDPDVIMVGEVRDEITAGICLKAAETGHVVISTLHTPDVVSTIKRFMGFFEGAQLSNQLSRFAECLQAAVSLRLIPRLDGKGRVPCVEILRVTHTVQECIRVPDRHGEILQHMVKGREMYGMQSFDQHLVDLVKDHVVSLDTAKLVASKPGELERALLVE